MSVGIAAIQGAANIYTPGSTRTFSAKSEADPVALGSGAINVLVSSRLDRLAENLASAADRMGSASAGSERLGAPDEQFGASELRYTQAEGRSGDGAAFDTVEKTLAAMRQMGQDAILAQANQLPTGAMPR
jgi:hypothetical protein